MGKFWGTHKSKSEITSSEKLWSLSSLCSCSWVLKRTMKKKKKQIASVAKWLWMMKKGVRNNLIKESCGVWVDSDFGSSSSSCESSWRMGQSKEETLMRTQWPNTKQNQIGLCALNVFYFLLLLFLTFQHHHILFLVKDGQIFLPFGGISLFNSF